MTDSRWDLNQKSLISAAAAVGANHIELIMRLSAALMNECGRNGTNPMRYEAYREAIGLYPNEDIPLKGP